MPRIVILTGGIGSGKSVVAAILQEKGIPVYDSDSRTKALYDSVPSLIPSLEEALGAKLRGEDGHLDRKALASIIFADSAAREKLEAIVYPLVRADFREWADANADAPFVVMESAVAVSKPEFESLGAKVVEVKAPLEERLRRVIGRDNTTEDAAMKRVSSQSEPDPARVDAVINNTSTLEYLAKEVDRVFFQNNSLFL